ncbi:MAG: hypothetical protein ACK5V3_06015 [Bdellovibrionales bacterium]
MASNLHAELTIVGTRPEPWDKLVEFMKQQGIELKHELQLPQFSSKKILAFHAPLKSRIKDIRTTSAGYDSIICEGLFAEESWPLLAELLKDISLERFEKLDSLLQSPGKTESVNVTSAKNRHSLKDQMVEYLKGQKVRTTITDRCFLVAEEMLMNAIYDAPTDPGTGKALFNHLSRKDDVHLQPVQYSTLEYGSKNKIVAVAVTDPFGALTRETLIDYLESCYSGHAGAFNEHAGKGGAGRGLHQIVENSDLTVFQVKRGERTRVVSYFWQKENPFGENPQLSFTYFD